MFYILSDDKRFLINTARVSYFVVESAGFDKWKVNAVFSCGENENPIQVGIFHTKEQAEKFLVELYEKLNNPVLP